MKFLKKRYSDIDTELLLDYQITDIPVFCDGLNLKLDLISSTGRGGGLLEFIDVYSMQLAGLPKDVEDCEQILQCLYRKLRDQELIKKLKDIKWPFTNDPEQNSLSEPTICETKIVTPYYQISILSVSVEMILDVVSS